MAVHHGHHRRGLHEALDAGRAGGGPQHAQRALDRRADQFLLVPGLLRGERRGDVQHVGAAGDGRVPAGVRLQVRRHELEPRDVGMVAERGLHVRTAGQRAHGAAHAVAGLKHLDRAVLCDEAGDTGDQDGGSGHVFSLRCGTNAAVGAATVPGRKRDSRCCIIAQLQETDTAQQRRCVDRRRLATLLGITA